MYMVVLKPQRLFPWLPHDVRWPVVGVACREGRCGWPAGSGNWHHALRYGGGAKWCRRREIIWAYRWGEGVAIGGGGISLWRGVASWGGGARRAMGGRRLRFLVVRATGCSRGRGCGSFRRGRPTTGLLLVIIIIFKEIRAAGAWPIACRAGLRGRGRFLFSVGSLKFLRISSWYPVMYTCTFRDHAQHILNTIKTFMQDSDIQSKQNWNSGSNSIHNGILNPPSPQCNTERKLNFKIKYYNFSSHQK